MAMHVQAHHNLLGPGENLDALLKVQFNEFAATINAFSNGDVFDLEKFVQRTVCFSNLRAFHGKDNIFDHDHSLYEDFLVFEEELFWFIMGKFPSVLAPKVYAARARLMLALENWGLRGGHEHAAPVVRERIQTSMDGGLTLQQACRAELGFTNAFMANSIPYIFWVIVTLFSKPDLMEEIREELDRSAAFEVSGGKATIRVSELRASIPLLTSLSREVLRVRSSVSTVRLVQEDTLIAGKYLLKQGNMVQMFSDIIHADQKIWGADVDDFNPYRFLVSPNGALNAQKDGAADGIVQPAAFRAFGSGKHLCPGRHFIQSEAVGLVAILALGWELKTRSGESLDVPPKRKVKMPFGIIKPAYDTEVLLQKRSGWENVQWCVE